MITRKNLLALAVTTSLAAGLVACGGDAPKDGAAKATVDSPAAAGDAAKKEGKCGGDKMKEGKCGSNKMKEGKCGDKKAAPAEAPTPAPAAH